MFFKKSLIAILFLVSFSKTKAQDFEMGKVSLAELQEKAHPIDTSAVAAILFKTGKVTFEYKQKEGFIKTTEVKTRIKIYKKEGYDWANQTVRYYIGGTTKQAVSFSDAVTYNEIGGKIEKTKLNEESVFDENINKYFAQKKITMPNVKVGSILEFQYKIKSKSVGAMNDWNFQSSIPVNYSEYVTFIPEYYIYSTNQKGFIYPKVIVDKKQKTVKFLNTARKEDGFITNNNNTSFYESSLQYEETKTSYKAENLPAMKEEAYVNNIDNYRSALVQELTMTQYPDEPLKAYSTDWEAVVKTIYDFDEFGAELNKTGYFEDDIDALINGLNAPQEKIAIIFNFVKKSIKWNRDYNFYCDKGVKNAYKDKTGNVAEINLMLTAMLRYAGINVNPVLLSTRENGVALYPNLNAFDYVIAAVEIPEGIVLLDATELYSLPNVLPLRDLNWFGRLIRKDGTSTQVSLTPQTQSKEVTNMNLILGKDGVIDGKIRIQLSAHNALAFRQKNLLTTTDTYLEGLENQNNNIEISDYVRENDLDLSKPIIEGYAFKDSKSIEIINDKIYVSPLLFLTTKENPFKQEIREYPVDFSYPFQNKYNVTIIIPEGFVVETLPAPINIATGENMGTFKYVTGTTGNKVQISITLDINTAIVSADYYDVLKAFYQQMIDKQNEKIVLKKI